MTELVNVSRDVAKLIKNKQLKEDDDRFIYLYSEWHIWKNPNKERSVLLINYALRLW